MKIIIEENERMIRMDVKGEDVRPEKVMKRLMIVTVEAIVTPLRKGLTDEQVQGIAENFSQAMAHTIVDLYKKREDAASAGLSNKEAAFLQALRKAGRES